MQKLTILLFLNFILISACTPKTFTSTPQEKRTVHLPAEAQIQRIVCFKFKAGTTPEAIKQHMRGFANLQDSISYILSYQVGPTVLGDLTEKPEYDVMHYCTYRSEEEIKLYSVHPVHQRFIKQNQGIWEKVLVINSRIIN
ncbi:Dabb family protein [Adhaeribacter radiodurans]|uniref:Dabb family protein n=1 Tax=Adhaeribacter radiodurans TaxID=2745197 RepID=A0A7L7L235_9BACT|nr:Dabb family protein [Adhaeribacter radiodurans]QMU26858.1 Dabb family protein [Adhaeribacter radiodurans]